MATVTPTEPTVTLWHGLYKSSWKGDIVDAAFQHPAKFSKALIFKIIEHAITEGWVRQGDTVIDPFGGVGLGGLPCALRGLQHLAVELEPRFVALANGGECSGDLAKHEACGETGAHGPHHLLGNLELWQRKYGVLPQWKQPILLQGDSRHLCQIIQQHADLLASSPPFLTGDSAGPESLHRRTDASAKAMLKSQGWNGGGQISPGNLAACPPGSLDAALVASSPPFLSARAGTTASTATAGGGPCADRNHTQADGDRLGTTEGNLAAMPPGSVDLALTSPPYADGCTHTGGADPQPQHVRGGPLRWVQYGADCAVASPPHTPEALGHKGEDKHPERSTHNSKLRNMNQYGGYGTTTGQLGTMPPGDVAAVVQGDCTVSSPPYLVETDRCRKHENKANDGVGGFRNFYSDDPRNLGNPAGVNGTTTFWEAAKQIVSETYKLLRPGAHAIWVCKRYVRDGKIVNFSQDWARLCEACGFELVHWHKAMLVDHYGEQGTFAGGTDTITVEKKSFFRKLSEKKGSPKIDWEDVICMVKPLTAAPLPPDEAWQQLPLVDADLGVSSPSYGGNAKSDYLLSTDGKTRQRDEKRGYAQGQGCFRGSETYGTADGQLGAMRVGHLNDALP